MIRLVHANRKPPCVQEKLGDCAGSAATSQRGRGNLVEWVLHDCSWQEGHWYLMSPIFRAKEPYILWERALYCMNESCVFHPKEPYVASKDDTEMSRECLSASWLLAIRGMLVHTETSMPLKRDLYSIQKRCIFRIKEPHIAWKGALCRVWRWRWDLAQWVMHDCPRQEGRRCIKRPIFHPKETYVPSKRALCCI